MVHIIIEKESDLNKLKKVLFNIINRIKFSFRRRGVRVADRVARKIVYSLRSRLAKAPYSSHSKRPGPWSRNGGRPSERSIRAKLIKDIVRIYVEDVGSVDAKGAIPPSRYLQIDKHGPYHHVEEAVSAAIRDLDKMLRNL